MCVMFSFTKPACSAAVLYLPMRNPTTVQFINTVLYTRRNDSLYSTIEAVHDAGAYLL